jgi:hypothetical protein
MVKIAVVAKVDRPAPELLKAIGQHSDAGLAELAGRFKAGEPVVIAEVTGTDWEESHASLRAVVTEFQRRGLPFELFESVDDQEPLDGRRITPEALENVLKTHARAFEEALDDLDGDA